MIEHIPSLTPEELIFEQAKLMKEHGRRLSALEERVERLEARIESYSEGYFTIAGYASLRGIEIDVSKAGMLGRKAVKVSRKCDYEILKSRDPLIGTVNLYHADVLKEVFEGLS
ncbi:MAG: hypothetical protein IJP54_08315 [Synergistaceae bacterium]|nr:hypothetical protein [Synergistaceae bacterium]MBQ6419140.1 hypothetical protein [Synergistaceae bacterium]MBR0035667.1 hypothetical protein [Synergistaceae bacterium]